MLTLNMGIIILYDVFLCGGFTKCIDAVELIQELRLGFQ